MDFSSTQGYYCNNKMRHQNLVQNVNQKNQIRLDYTGIVLNRQLESINHLLTNQLSKFQISIKNKNLNS